MATQPRKPPYLLGLLGVIPFVGAFIGVGLVLYGVFYYKSRTLIIIGAASILWTVGLYSALFYFTQNSSFVTNAMVQSSQQNLDALAQDIEYYKMEAGSYPDSLNQVYKLKKIVFMPDPLATFKIRSHPHIEYYYQKKGEQYTLFSAGVDNIPYTADDLYPNIPDSGRIKFGWIKR